jgi:hypothetical protein
MRWRERSTNSNPNGPYSSIASRNQFGHVLLKHHDFMHTLGGDNPQHAAELANSNQVGRGVRYAKGLAT